MQRAVQGDALVEAEPDPVGERQAGDADDVVLQPLAGGGDADDHPALVGRVACGGRD